MSGHDDGDTRTAEAVLAARFDPLAGSIVWSSRISAELRCAAGCA